jgi:hypothetical protein
MYNNPYYCAFIKANHTINQKEEKDMIPLIVILIATNICFAIYRADERKQLGK